MDKKTWNAIFAAFDASRREEPYREPQDPPRIILTEVE